MPRKLRGEYPGAIDHVLNRGDRREDIFKDDLDRQQFLSALEEACQKTQCQVHADCLMRHPSHLVIETRQGNWVAGKKWLPGVYTEGLNIRHKECGHVFAGRYKALGFLGVVDSQALPLFGAGVETVMSIVDSAITIHRNEVRGFCVSGYWRNPDGILAGC